MVAKATNPKPNRTANTATPKRRHKMRSGDGDGAIGGEAAAEIVGLTCSCISPSAQSTGRFADEKTP
jgi:hypothetical protein